MNKLLLREYLYSLPPAEREAFARRCGTTFGYLRKSTYLPSKIGGELAVAIDRESRGAVRCEELRPDIDWSYVRRTWRRKPPTVDSSPAGAAA